MQTPSENTDVKMDTLDEPSAHLIEENVALPEDTFSSHLSYCHEFFTTLIKEVNSGSHSDSSSNSAEDTQSSVSAGKTSNGPNNFDSIRSDPILMAYVLKATQIEKEAQSEYWRKQYPDADLP
ncbi:ULP1-interacting protein 3 [Saccharomyces cerevisiae]